MKKNNRETAFWVLMMIFLFVVTVVLPILCVIYDKPLVAHAEDNPYGTPFPMYTTAYYYGDTTASGHPAREGICAVRSEWMGLTAVVYANDNGEVGEVL